MTNNEIPPEQQSARFITTDSVASPDGQSSGFDSIDERLKASTDSAQYLYNIRNVSKDESTCPNNYTLSTGEKHESVLIQN